MARKLTDKQEAFAYAFVETGNASEAYRAAYDVGANAKPAGIWANASKLMADPRIAERVAETRAQLQEARHFTVLAAMDELEQARSNAMDNSQFSAAVSAVNAKVKLAGLDKPIRIQEVGPSVEPVVSASNRELACALAAILSKGLRKDAEKPPQQTAIKAER